MSMNWLEGMHDHADGSDRPQAMAMPVFAGQKLVAVGGSSGMGEPFVRGSHEARTAGLAVGRRFNAGRPSWPEDIETFFSAGYAGNDPAACPWAKPGRRSPAAHRQIR